MKKISLIIGGTKGIGSVITKTLKKRGDKIITVSRSKLKNTNHISLDLNDLANINSIKQKFFKKKIDNLIFSQRYRGNFKYMDYNLMVKSTDKIIHTLKDCLSNNSSIIVLSSIATTTVVEDQNAEYHYTRGALESLVKYYAVKFGPKGTRVNCIQPTVIFKPENKKFYKKKITSLEKLLKKLLL